MRIARVRLNIIDRTLRVLVGVAHKILNGEKINIEDNIDDYQFKLIKTSKYNDIK